MIKSIIIKKLFGRFNYTLNFLSERIMIITGPNGYGKSTILRMINSFCNDDFSVFLNYSFSSFIVRCKLNTIEIKKNENFFMINNFSFPYPVPKQPSDEEKIDINTHDDYVTFLLNRTFNNLSQDFEKKTLIEKYYDKSTNNFIFKLIDNAFSKRPHKNDVKNLLVNIKSAFDQIDNIKKEIGAIHFIQEQRLIEKREEVNNKGLFRNEQEIKYVNVINENSEKLKSELAEIMRQHSSLSSTLDSSYIRRLFAENSGNKSVKEVRSQLQLLQEKQNKLKKYGLADIDNVSYITKLDKEKLNKFSAEMAIFLEDASTKFAIFEPIINKLDLYERIVNKKLTFKKISLTSTHGIMISSDEGKNLLLDELSSGEQEILVLFYKLIFESDVNLLLIDEPEISLHIAWQKELMNDFKEVINLNKGMQMIIATHSPQIISDNWDLQIDLGEQYNG